jgi:hypothetical protein
VHLHNTRPSLAPTAALCLTSPPQPAALMACGRLTSSGARNSGVPPGSVGVWKKELSPKSTSFSGEDRDLKGGGGGRATTRVEGE